MRIKVNAFVVLAGILGLLGGFLWGTVLAAGKQSKPIPPAVLESVRKTFPRARVRRVSARPEIVQIYHVDMVENGRRAKAEVVVNGEILTVYRQISAGDAPQAVFDSLRREMGRGELERLVKKETHATISISSFGRPRVQYRAFVETEERETRLTFDARGRVVDRQIGEEEVERELSLEQLPDPVRETILRHAAGHRVREVEMHTRGGKRFYEAEWMENGREVEVSVDPSGKVLGQEIEEEEDEEWEDDD
jgi:hypothetical protein